MKAKRKGGSNNYRRLLQEGANVVVLEPDVAKAFRSSDATPHVAFQPPPDKRSPLTLTVQIRRLQLRVLASNALP